MRKYIITEDTMTRLIKFLYQDLENDNTCVETNELLDALEHAEQMKGDS